MWCIRRDFRSLSKRADLQLVFKCSLVNSWTLFESIAEGSSCLDMLDTYGVMPHSLLLITNESILVYVRDLFAKAQAITLLIIEIVLLISLDRAYFLVK